ncbi:hypothetical protein [Chitinophaga defluvii]|uniref:Two component regulator with propeller domain n=1 Tax=Chitinophaga defluvii TaxID=3163343 RepID=A0ABV2T4P8_9BACT
MITRLFVAGGCLLFTLATGKVWANDPDTPFKQAISVKYPLPDELKGSTLKKVVTDYNDIAYVLSNKGLYRVSDNKLIRDVRFRPLAQKIPVDITAQEGAGHLYYLYEDKFLTNGYAGVPYGLLPKGKFNMLAVAEDGTVLLAGKNATGLYRQGKLINIPAPGDALLSIQAKDGAFYGFSTRGVYQLAGERWEAIHKGNNLQSVAFRGNEIILGTANGYFGIDKATGDSTFGMQTKVPVQNISQLAVVNGHVWAGTPIGAFMKENSGKFRYYASKRWLDNDQITGITADSEGNIFLLTNSGLNKIEFSTQTLEKKAVYFQNKIRDRHIRYGFISNIHLKSPGDLASAEMADTDNDGLWSAFYLGSQAFRYQVTGDKKAKRYAWEAFEAFERLLSINQLKGFPSRTFERKGYKNSDPEHWRDSPDPEWEWKGHTSSDEFVAYIFIAAVLDEMVAETEGEKKRVAAFMDKILMHLLDNNYYFIDVDGKPTLWGRWNPEYINMYPETIGDRKLGSTTIIAGLQLGYALTGKEIYKTEAYRLMKEHGYLKNILVDYNTIKATPGFKHMGIDLGMGGWNHSDDEMAFLTYWVLERYAFTPELQQQFKGVILNHWQLERPEKNPLWNLITLATAGTYDEAATFWYLREYPLDQVRWGIKNSHRKDLVFLPDNFRGQTTTELIPPGEQPMHRHNANAFNLDSKEQGTSELAGDEYLLPYWLGRYLKVIE